MIKVTVGSCAITNRKYAKRQCEFFREMFIDSDGMFRDGATFGADGFWRVRCRQGVFYTGDGLPGQPHLLYVEEGKVLGYIYYCEIDYADDEAGCFTVVVHPQHRRCGIGTKLLIAAQKEWGIDFGKQQYTRAGAALVRRKLGKENCPSEEAK